MTPPSRSNQRLLVTNQLTPQAQQELARLYCQLNPVALRMEIANLGHRLWAAREVPKTARAGRRTG